MSESRTVISLKEMDVDSPQVKIPPPVVFLGCIILGLVLDNLMPMFVVPREQRGWWGVLFFVPGAFIIIWCVKKFKRAGTNIEPWKRATHLIMDGLYRYSRNPIYGGGILLLLGIGLGLNNLWICLTVVPFFMFLNGMIIPKEEKYLESKFRESYISYKRRVRRWI